MRLLLFDVDLTLVNTGGAGRLAMQRSFEDLFGIESGMNGVSFAGRTDRAIYRDAVTLNQLEWRAEEEQTFKNRYLEYLETEITKPNPEKHVEPGITELLPLLGERQDVTLGLLTGNWRRGAKIKLEHFGLFDYFVLGAFADDSENRNELPEIAANRFRDFTGKSLRPSEVFVIGDTPLDVVCARSFGATSVSVATGFFAYGELQACKPDFLFHDLSNVREFMNLLNHREG